ncbi:uncharacterized protein [Pyxicephalus adspersus]|uniref:uncharacterized protein n=1 Tax=Pyxicephalus adspersus TaxID=30357 RepID=UPI003B59E802
MRRGSQDIMYENTEGPEPPRRNDPSPAMGSGINRMTGLQKWFLHLFLICLLLCLLLSATLIVLIVKYIPDSSSLKRPEAVYHKLNGNATKSHRSGEDNLAPLRSELVTESGLGRTSAGQTVWGNFNMTMSLGRREDNPPSVTGGPMTTNSKLNETQLELEKALQAITDLKNSLTYYQNEEQKATTERLAMEERMKDTRLKMDQWEKAFCPNGWFLFGKTCLWISEEQRTWEDSDRYCKEKRSNLIIVPWNDTALQDFLAEKQGGFWVGKELTWMWPVQWEWPSGYKSTGTGSCWKMTGGNLKNVSCMDNNRWICEKNIVLTSFQSASSGLEFNLFRAKFYCYRQST